MTPSLTALQQAIWALHSIPSPQSIPASQNTQPGTSEAPAQACSSFCHTASASETQVYCPHYVPLLPLPLVPLFSHQLEDYSSFPSIPNTSPLLRQDRAAETSCRPLWHAMSAFWLQRALCTQQQTETWQSLRSLHRPTKPSPASSIAYPLAFMGILHAHRTENRDPGCGLQRILA